MRIILIGPPGAGKSTLAWNLADTLNKQAFDSDVYLLQYVQECFGREATLSHALETWGRKLFSLKEYEQVHALFQANQEGIFSLGGGVVCSEQSRSLLKKESFVFYLQVSAQVLMQHLKGALPNFLKKRGQGREALERLLKERIPLYQEVATHTLQVEQKSPHELGQMIQKEINHGS